MKTTTARSIRFTRGFSAPRRPGSFARDQIRPAPNQSPTTHPHSRAELRIENGIAAGTPRVGSNSVDVSRRRWHAARMIAPAAPQRSSGLRLRPLAPSDERAFTAAHRQMEAEDFPFGLAYDPSTAFTDYVTIVNSWRVGLGLVDDWVASTFVVAEVDGEIVGRSSIRHELNAFLAREGGHIGYAVVAEHRRQGYATEILRQSLVIARAIGVDRVLITCDDDNVASACVIERCGGVLDSVLDRDDGGGRFRRYWID